MRWQSGICSGIMLAMLLGSIAWAVEAKDSQSEEGSQKVPELAHGQSVEGITDEDLPYVYTKWENFTVKEGLPNDHVFAVRCFGDKVWVGTEDGLACYDKKTKTFQVWKEKDGLPWRAITGIDVCPKTGDVWLALFGGGVARFSGGRFDHFHQLNSGLVNDVVYGIAVENDNVWCATTAGNSRYNRVTGEWTIFTEKNAPMEEIWNYHVSYAPEVNKVFLAVWGSGCLEFDVPTQRWKVYLDPDREMEVDLYRDDGIIHVIVTSAHFKNGALWVSAYFGNCRYDGRYWRGFYAHETGFPSDFTNSLRARSDQECWMCTDKGVGVVAHYASDTYVSYYRNGPDGSGRAEVFRQGRKLKEVPLKTSIAHNFIIAMDFDGDDVWIGTSKGLARGIGEGYYPGLKKSPDWLKTLEQDSN